MSIPADYKCNQWGWFWKESDNSGPYYLGSDGLMHQLGMSSGELTKDAWGIGKVSIAHSVFHGLFTFDIPPAQWFTYHNGVQVYASTNITSVLGAANIVTSVVNTVCLLESRATPRYQPNRGHLFSTAGWFPLKTADGIRDWGLATVENGVLFRLKSDGNLYAVLKSLGVVTREELIDTSRVPGFDVEKGNVYDIQYQWRGVGNYTFFINLIQVHVFENLGTLTALSMADPALPIQYKATRLTQDVSMFIGCADISSENGNNDRLQYGSVFAAAPVNGSNVPLVVIHNPLLILGKTNTRMLELARISLTSDKKAVFKVWSTRDPTALVGGTRLTIGNGSYVTTDSNDAVTGAVITTSVVVAKLKLIVSITVPANTQVVTNNPYQASIDFPLVRGDYLVITGVAAQANCEAVIEFGEAL